MVSKQDYLSVLAECGTHHTCTDSCGVCKMHFNECEHDLFAVALDAEDEKLEIPKGRGYACPGAKARALLEDRPLAWMPEGDPDAPPSLEPNTHTITDEQKLELVHRLLNVDGAEEATTEIEHDIYLGRKVTKAERVMQRVLSKIYHIVHPEFCSADHKDWKEEAKKMYEELESLKNE